MNKVQYWESSVNYFDVADKKFNLFQTNNVQNIIQNAFLLSFNCIKIFSNFI